MLTLQDLHCPICGNGAVEIGKNNLILCLLHGWTELAIKAVDIHNDNRPATIKNYREGK